MVGFRYTRILGGYAALILGPAGSWLNSLTKSILFYFISSFIMGEYIKDQGKAGTLS